MPHPARLVAVGLLLASLTGAALRPVDPPRPLATEAEVRAALAKPAPDSVDGLTLDQLADRLFTDHRLVVRVDSAEWLRLTDDHCVPPIVAKLRLSAIRTRGLTVADLMAEVAAEIDGVGDKLRDWRATFRVRGNQVVLTPAYRPVGIPGGGVAPDFQPMIPVDLLAKQLIGPPVTAVLDSPLTKAIEQLRFVSGANVVLDPRVGDKVVARVAGTFDDVRLLTVLQVLADQAGLKVVTMSNVYYLTDPTHAAELQRVADLDIRAERDSRIVIRPVPVPPGFVTDGYKYFAHTPDLKETNPGKMLGVMPPGPPPPMIVPVAPPAEKK